jgi:hypothetical protein
VRMSCEDVRMLREVRTGGGVKSGVRIKPEEVSLRRR